MKIKKNLFFGGQVVRVPQECQEFFTVPNKRRLGTSILNHFSGNKATTVVFAASPERLEKVGRAKALHVRQWSEKHGIKAGKGYELVSSPEPTNSEHLEIEAHISAHRRTPVNLNDVDISTLPAFEIPSSSKKKNRFIRPYKTIGGRKK